jgi:peptidoglycan/LPS O-acetylase OafA/YrhL
VSERGLLEVAKQTAADLVRLAKLEYRYAGDGIKRQLRTKGVGAGMLAGAAVVAVLGLLILLSGGIAALALVLPVWAALLVVGGAFVLIAVALVLVGRSRLRAGSPVVPPETRERLAEDVRWLREQTR